MNKKCSHCEFIDNIAKGLIEAGDSTNREYWLLTEFYVYLHNGKDFCNNLGGQEDE